LQQTIRTGW